MHSVVSKAAIKQQALTALTNNIPRTSNPYPPGSIAHDLWYGYYTEELTRFAAPLSKSSKAVVNLENIS